MNRCLFCYHPLSPEEKDFHPGCTKKIFGESNLPVLPIAETDIEALAKQEINDRITVTGVQPKLSINIQPGGDKSSPKRFTIAGIKGGYILKPPSKNYPELPEVEDLTMHLATLAKINTVPHSLIRMHNGSLAYITKRIDRTTKSKIHMEDMCQLTERTTEAKYRGSYEQIAKTILKYSKNPGLDVINFFEQVLFSFLTGNADMHLKNFSLINRPGIGYTLSPGYDMIATALVNPADKEDLALTLNAKKNKIKKADFISAFNTLNLDPRQQENIFRKMEVAKEKWLNLIDISFLSSGFKTKFKEIITERFSRI